MFLALRLYNLISKHNKMKKIILLAACFGIFITSAIAQEPVKPKKESAKKSTSVPYSKRKLAAKSVTDSNQKSIPLNQKAAQKAAHN